MGPAVCRAAAGGHHRRSPLHTLASAGAVANPPPRSGAGAEPVRDHRPWYHVRTEAGVERPHEELVLIGWPAQPRIEATDRLPHRTEERARPAKGAIHVRGRHTRNCGVGATPGGHRGVVVQRSIVDGTRGPMSLVDPGAERSHPGRGNLVVGITEQHDPIGCGANACVASTVHPGGGLVHHLQAQQPSAAARATATVSSVQPLSTRTTSNEGAAAGAASASIWRAMVASPLSTGITTLIGLRRHRRPTRARSRRAYPIGANGRLRNRPSQEANRLAALAQATRGDAGDPQVRRERRPVATQHVASVLQRGDRALVVQGGVVRPISTVHDRQWSIDRVDGQRPRWRADDRSPSTASCSRRAATPPRSRPRW